MLVNRPCKFVIQLPSNEAEYQTHDGQKERQCDDDRFDLVPKVRRESLSVADLADLDCRFDC